MTSSLHTGSSKKILFVFFSLAIFIFSCKKDPVVSDPEIIPAKTSGDIILNFTNVAGNEVIKISPDEAYSASTPKYKNNIGDTFSVIEFKYYISNIKLKRDDGTYYTENESYHLVNAADTGTSCKIKLSNIPFGNYTSLEFSLGIDSARNMGGAQTGDLDAAYGMYWDWNQGFIFMRFFAYSNSAPANTSHNVTYDIGGVGTDRKIVLPVSANSLVINNNNVEKKVYLKTDLLECFKNPNNISFVFLFEAMTPLAAAPLIANYADIFSISAIK